MAPSKPTIVLTGFGPFGGYKINSSWVAVKELADIGLDDDNFNLEVKEISVEYEVIDKKVPGLWKKHKPLLMVHVGVSGFAQAITLEQLAHNYGYNQTDIKKKCPKHNCCKRNGEETLKSTIDMQDIAESDRVKKSGINVAVSQDPGRYCCDYIYYTSLSMKQAHTVFIHVPPLNRPYSGNDLALGIKAIITAILERISVQHN
ncbi:unnamed protein product [Clavelina lepadiformis]|uniref:Pyroglutamyl-peptidase I n=1 Tax=Clavelina lepadiformis TaxID=159417 RepID=A0ABP0GMX9_CLALP